MAPIYKVPLSNNSQYTLDTQYTAGGTSLVLNTNVASVVQAPGTCVVDRVDSSGNKTPSKRTYYTFTGVSTTTLTGLAVADGTDQAHAVGAVVEFVPDITWAQSIYNGLTAVVDAATQLLDTTKVVDLTTAQTLTNKRLTSPKINEAVALTSTATELNLLTGVTALGTASSTTTFTNKRIEPRIVSAASYTTDTGTSLSVATADEFVVTAQAGALLFNAPGGTPVEGQKLIIRIKDNGTARALTYNAIFRASSDLALPTTTVLSKVLYMGFIYNSTDTKWDLLAVMNNI